MTITTQAPVQAAISINAPSSEVWRMFTDAAFSRQLGGEYVSDWKEGAAIDWKNNSGKLVSSGKIISIEPGRYLQYLLFHNDTGVVTSTVTCDLVERDGQTTIYAWEEFSCPVTKEEFKNAKAAWTSALNNVKTLLEK